MVVERETNWVELFEQALAKSEEAQSLFRPGFQPPAEEGAIAAVEAAIGVAFPSELRSLLRECNGVDQQMNLGGEAKVVGSLIWPIERIKEDNLRFRSDPEYREIYMPFDHLLFFADAGNGDQFAYGIKLGQVRNTTIYVWDHEDDSRRWVASSLADFIERSLSGKLKI